MKSPTLNPEVSGKKEGEEGLEECKYESLVESREFYKNMEGTRSYITSD
jgi:hypothetical protein